MVPDWPFLASQLGATGMPGRGQLLVLVACLCAAFAAPQPQTRSGLQARPEYSDAVQNATRQSRSSILPGDSPTRELTLCECEKAVGSPDGLGCEKEGWFISNFEREGSWAQGAMGLVPLSHAICCRPCLPDSLPEHPSSYVGPDDKPVAVVSIGCHASSGSGTASMQCEADGGSFVTGWAAAVRVSSAIDAYYPEGAVECCTPSLLLSSGDAWQLERCDCQFSGDINCGQMETHRLLEGFFTGRRAITGELVPTAPAKCCKACLGQQFHPINSCNALNQCSGRGVCALGACQCRTGWTGADCSQRAAGGGGGLPGWLTALIVICSSLAFITLLTVFSSVVRYLQIRHEQEHGSDEDGEALRAPLILHVGEDDDGSVGSDDTTECHSDLEEALAQAAEREQNRTHREPLGGGEYAAPAGAVEQPAAAAPQGTPVGSLPYSPSQGTPLEARLPSQGHDHPSATDSDDSASGDEEPVPAAAGEIEEVLPHQDESHPQQQDSESPATKDEGGKDGLEPWAGTLTGVSIAADCSVCMNRPVQVVVIPCGHACMCRRCSRRLVRCPVCRKEVARRQRLFMGG